MSRDDHPHAPKRSDPKVVELVELAPAAIHALAAGDLAAANRASPVVLTPYLASAECRRTWQRRSSQIQDNPVASGWVTRIIYDPQRRVAVGRAGFHGPPDPLGMVEVGYAVDPAHRRQGYARAALVALLDRAAREPSVHTVRATIGPDNLASRSLVSRYGFVEVGEQWDDEDGLETIFEVRVD